MTETTEALRRRLTDLATRPDEQAHSMPAAYYTDPDWLTGEEEMLHSQWMCVGHIGEVRKPGDFLTTELLGEQLLIARDQDGVLRVLSNVCRHRGNKVATGAGNARKFICSYHAWAYGADGGLLSAPLMKGSDAFDPDCKLPEFAHEVWNGWLFVNLDGSAPPLTPQLSTLQGVVANYHPDNRFLVFMEEDIWRCNWKSLFENFMEGYHLSATHLDTLHPITPTHLCRKMVGSDAHTGYHAFYDPSYPPRGPFHEDLTEEERNNSPMYGVYPNLVVGMATNFTLFMILRPHGPDQVKIRWGVAGLADAPDSEKVADYVALCRSFNAEDKAKLETLQVALASRHYDGGPLAPADFEGCVWDFLKWMAQK